MMGKKKDKCRNNKDFCWSTAGFFQGGAPEQKLVGSFLLGSQLLELLANCFTLMSSDLSVAAAFVGKESHLSSRSIIISAPVQPQHRSIPNWKGSTLLFTHLNYSRQSSAPIFAISFSPPVMLWMVWSFLTWLSYLDEHHLLLKGS